MRLFRPRLERFVQEWTQLLILKVKAASRTLCIAICPLTLPL